MIRRVCTRWKRAPLIGLAVLLLSATFTVILCELHRAQVEEQSRFAETCRAVPVTFEITKLNGGRLDETEHMEAYLAELFCEDRLFKSGIAEMVTDVQLRMSHTAVLAEEEPQQAQNSKRMVGVTSLDMAQELTPEYGGIIQWRDGYDESAFAAEEMACIVPADFPEQDEVTLTFTYQDAERNAVKEYTCTFRVVGRYSDEGNERLYCAFAALAQIYTRLNEPNKVQRLTGRLADNDALETFRETAGAWFAFSGAANSANPARTFAIDIKDSLLRALTADLQSSMTINRIASLLIFLLSTGAGFLTGFLVIRARKREITLMRTLGASNAMVCAELALEQGLGVCAGGLLGGCCTLFQPIGRIILFIGVFLAGTAAALLFFVRMDLLAVMKEDE